MRLKEIPCLAEEYEYEPLDLTRHQIRLLALKPSTSWDDPIECGVRVFNMDDAPYYITLSYVWGDILPRRRILLNGKWLYIRENLFDFLLCFRDDPSNVQYLWIDQLCIAQTLDLERNHQVQLMSRVYKRCLYVIVWLGETSYPHASGFDQYPERRVASKLFHNRYFRRLWVVQEVFLAPQIRFFCGRHTADFEAWNLDSNPGSPTMKLLGVAHDMEDSDNNVERVWVPLDALVRVMLGRDVLGSDVLKCEEFFDSVFSNPDILRHPDHRGLLPLAECINRYSKYECFNQCDKVYGLLGLVMEEQRPMVDYQKSREEVIADVLMILSALHWNETKDVSFIPNTKVPKQYWVDASCLTRLAKSMDMEDQCSPISYLVEHVYETIARAKSNKMLDFPIQAIGHTPDQGGQWWYQDFDLKHSLLASPTEPAWANRGLNVGIPGRFQPHPEFHFDGTPWV